MPYALPCICGSKVFVQRSQAGSQVICPVCQRSLEIPTIRGLAEFEVAEGGTTFAPSERAVKSHWTPLRGMIAATCVLVALIGLGRAGFYGAYRISHPTPFTVEGMLSDIEQTSQQLSPADAWDIWCVIQESGLGRKNPPDAFVIKRRLEQADSQMFRWAIAGFVGLLGVLAALFWPTQRGPRQK